MFIRTKERTYTSTIQFYQFISREPNKKIYLKHCTYTGSSRQFIRFWKSWRDVKIEIEYRQGTGRRVENHNM